MANDEHDNRIADKEAQQMLEARICACKDPAIAHVDLVGACLEDDCQCKAFESLIDMALNEPLGEPVWEPLRYDKWSALAALVDRHTLYEVVEFVKGKGIRIADGRIITAMESTIDTKYQFGELWKTTFLPAKRITKAALRKQREEATMALKLGSKTSSKTKSSRRNAREAFLATLNGKRVLFLAKEAKAGPTVPASATVKEYAEAHGFEIIAREKAPADARTAYEKAWRSQHVGGGKRKGRK